MNSSSSIQPPDQAVRLKAIDHTQSFAVSAPAGSGKTGLLTQRVLKLLAHCEQPEEVLAITFTRKAAGEMQDRIMHALWQAAEAPEPTDTHALRTWELAQAVLTRDKLLQWNLLQSPQRLRITTIDSLCRNITQQLPLASGIGAQPDTLESPEQAYRLAVAELFKLLDKESLLREHLARLLRHLDNNLVAVEKLLVGLLAKREQWLGVLLMARHEMAREYFESVLEATVIEHLTQLNLALQLHASELCALADTAAKNLQEEGERKNSIHLLLGSFALPPTSTEALPQWLALADLLLTNSGSYRSRLTKTEGFPPGKENTELKNRFANLIAALNDTHPEAESLIADLRQLPPIHYAPEQWQLLESLTQILPQLVAELMLVFKQLAATDYSAISQAALIALGDYDEPSDLALKLDYRIRHILVDEFQDTASPQLELLKKLTQGWEADDGRTLFIVGDGMQSCYGFRNANVGLFLDARQQGIGNVALAPMDLCVNFRSQFGVVDWVNKVFSTAFPAQDDISRGAVKYSASIAFKPALKQDAVEVHIATYNNDENNTASENFDDSDDENNFELSYTDNAKTLARQQEAAKVVELVRQAQADNPNGSIAILVRTRSHLSAILPALNQAKLSYQATEIDRLSSRMAIIDLRSLTRALLNPADRIAWLAILRAPWCGLSLQDIHVISNEIIAHQAQRLPNKFPVIWQQLRNIQLLTSLSTEGKARLEKLVFQLDLAWQSRQRKPLRQWLEGLWIALGGPACLLDTNDQENIQSYFALVDKHQEAGVIRDWNAFDQAMEKLFAAPKPDANPNLQVMTIHKSKGLEFDTVIIPGLDRSNRADEKELLLWQERLNHHGEKQLLLGSFAPIGKEDDKLYKFMRAEASKQQQFEATRLLYVGCTRAINQLHLLGCIQEKAEALKAPAKQSLLSCIWPEVKEQAKIINSRLSPQTTTNQINTRGHIARLSSKWSLPEFNHQSDLKAFWGKEYAADIAINPKNIPAIETRQARLARHTGTLIHRALEILVAQAWVALNKSAQKFIAVYERSWHLQLVQLGYDQSEISSALEKIHLAIINSLNSEKGRWILDSRHQDSECELAIVQINMQGTGESIIDRTFIADGKRWIIDYKSSEPNADLSLEAFIQQEVETYRPQLTRYSEIMSTVEDLPITTALFFTSIGHLTLVT